MPRYVMSMWYQWFTPAPRITMERPLVLLGVGSELARDMDDVGARHAGHALGPGRRVWLVLVVVGCHTAAAEPTIQRRNWRISRSKTVATERLTVLQREARVPERGAVTTSGCSVATKPFVAAPPK